MKEVSITEIKDGENFVAVWEFRERIWSDTLKMNTKALTNSEEYFAQYSVDSFSFTKFNKINLYFLMEVKTKFFIWS